MFYPDLTLAAVAGDAAFGYDLPLAMICSATTIITQEGQLEMPT
jgi:hypothetical protein